MRPPRPRREDRRVVLPESPVDELASGEELGVLPLAAAKAAAIESGAGDVDEEDEEEEEKEEDEDDDVSALLASWLRAGASVEASCGGVPASGVPRPRPRRVNCSTAPP